jgi:hypothetical protein
MQKARKKDNFGAAIFIPLAGYRDGMGWQRPLHGTATILSGTGTVLSLGWHGMGTVPDMGRVGAGQFSPWHWTIYEIEV